MVNTRVITIVLSCLIATGCTSFPKQELVDYRDAFENARNVSQEVLLEYSNASDLVRQKTANSKAKENVEITKPYPDKITSNDTQSANNEVIETRIKALNTISKYNAVLNDLAEGKSVDQVASSAKSLINTLSSVVSIAPGIGPLITSFAVEIEKARSRAELKKAIDSGEPIVVKILEFLSNERDNYYQTYKSIRDYDSIVIARRIKDRIGAMKKMASEKSAPSDSGKLISIAQDVEKSIQPVKKYILEIKTQIELIPFKGKPNSSSTFTATFEQELKQMAKETDDDAIQYLQIVDQVNAYYSMLADYGQLLDKSRTALTSLRIAIDTPQSASTQISEVVSTTLKLRADIIKFRHQN